MNVGIKEIKEADARNKAHGNEFKWSYYLRRPASHYISLPFLRLGVSASTITLLWLFLGIAGCISIASGSYVFMIAGGVLLEFAIILDRVDGIVARFKRPTLAGGILDTWCGVILLSLSMFSLGVGISKNIDGLTISKILIPYFELDNYLFIFVGFFAAFSTILGWAIRGTWRSTAAKFSGDMEVDKPMRSSKSVFIADNLFHYNGAYFALLVFSIILGAADLFVMLVALIYGVHFMMIVILILRNAHAVDKRNVLEK